MGGDVKPLRLTRPDGNPVWKSSWAMPALRHLSDGRWFGPYQDDAYDRLGNRGWLKLTMSAVWAGVMGLIEIDKDGWWRITPAGRRALTEATPPSEGGREVGP